MVKGLRKFILLKILLPLTLISVFLSMFVILLGQNAFNQERMLLSKKYNEAEKARAATEGDFAGSDIVLSAEVLALKERVLTEAKIYGTEAYLNIFLAVMMQESGGKVEDVFQCSESLGKPRNSLSKEESIKQGVKLLSGYIEAAGVTSPADIEHIRLALQAYNFGGGFISFANNKTGGWSQEATDAYAKIHSKGKKRSGINAERMGVWAYGDQYYTDHVLRYYSTGMATNSTVVQAAMKLLGRPYRYGAAGPDEFDCSGLVYYVFKTTGVFVGSRMSAQGYKSIATPITESEAREGDLVFFTNASGTTHHIGIYIGDGKMIHAPQTGDVVKISNIWREKDTISFGRLGQ